MVSLTWLQVAIIAFGYTNFGIKQYPNFFIALKVSPLELEQFPTVSSNYCRQTLHEKATAVYNKVFCFFYLKFVVLDANVIVSVHITIRQFGMV